MRAAGQLAAQCLDMITAEVKPGVSTEHLDQLIHQFILDHGAIPATLGYRGYPKSCCTSVNEVICHGIPSPQEILQPKDIVNIDVTVILEGWFGDTSRMYVVGGETFGQRQKLVDTTFDAMWAGIEAVKPGATGAMLAPPFKRWQIGAVFRLLRILLVMVLVKNFMNRQRLSIQASLDRAWSCILA